MEVLKFINEQMAAISIPYEFGEWQSDVKYPYYVGEITEEPITTEDGLEEYTLMVTGFHRGKYIDLEKDKEKIKKHFDPISGLSGKIDSGVIVAYFDGAFYVPSGEASLKKIQMNLKIKVWKGA